MKNKHLLFRPSQRRASALPLAVMAAAIGLVASPGVEAATTTHDFTTNPANWTATTPAGGQNIGWSNTGNATGNAGEAGGTIARSQAYATYLTSLTGFGLDRTSTLTMSGSMYLDNTSYDGAFYLGFFDTAGLVSGSAPANFVGILFEEPANSGAPNYTPNPTGPFRSYARVNGAGSVTGATISLTQEQQYTFNLTYTGTSNGSGTMTGTLGGIDIGTVNVGAGSASFNAFGLASGGLSSSNPAQTGQLFFDSVTYTVPEPSAALLGGLGMLALLRRRR